MGTMNEFDVYDYLLKEVNFLISGSEFTFCHSDSSPLTKRPGGVKDRIFVKEMICPCVLTVSIFHINEKNT